MTLEQMELTHGPALELVELDRRQTDVLRIELAWRPSDNALQLVLTNLRTGEAQIEDLEPTDGLDALEHPCAYSRVAAGWVRDAEALFAA